MSIVAIPANRLARITRAKSLQSKAEAIEMLRECGLSKALGNDDTQRKSIQLEARIDAAIAKKRTS